MNLQELQVSNHVVVLNLNSDMNSDINSRMNNDLQSEMNSEILNEMIYVNNEKNKEMINGITNKLNSDGLQRDKYIDGTIRNICTIHDDVYGVNEEYKRQLMKVSINQHHVLDSKCRYHPSESPIISPNNMYIMNIVIDTSNDQPWIYVRRIKDDVIEKDPFMTCKYDKYYMTSIFTPNSRYLLSFNGRMKEVQIYDMESPSDDQLFTHTIVFNHMYTDDNMIDMDSTEVLSSYYYYHDHLIGKELKDHISISNPTRMIVFILHQEGRRKTYRSIMMGCDRLNDMEKNEDIMYDEMVFTNIDKIYNRDYERHYIDIYRHNYLMIISCNKNTPGMCISTYRMHLKKREGMNIIDIELDAITCKSYTYIHPYHIQPTIQRQYISSNYMHIVDRVAHSMYVYDLDMIHCEPVIIRGMGHRYDTYSVLDDGQYILCRDNRCIDILYKHNDAYISIYKHDSDKHDDVIYCCTMSIDMRYMCITRRNKQEYIVMNLYDHTSYKMIVNNDDYFEIEEVPQYRSIGGIYICRFEHILRYMYRDHTPRDIDMRRYTTFDYNTIIQYYYNEYNNRILVLYQQQDERDIHVIDIDIDNNCIEMREDIVNSRMMEDRRVYNTQYGYLYDSNGCIYAVMFKHPHEHVVIPNEYNNDDHMVCVHDDIVILLKRNFNDKLASVIWIYIDSKIYHTIDISIDIDVGIGRWNTGRGEYHRYTTHIEYMKENKSIVLWNLKGYVLIGCKKKAVLYDEMTYTNIEHVIVSSDGRYIGMYDRLKNILSIQSTVHNEHNNIHYVYDVRYDRYYGIEYIVQFSDSTKRLVVTKTNGDIEYINMYNMSIDMVIESRYKNVPRMYDSERIGDLVRYTHMNDGVHIVYGNMRSAHRVPYTVSRVVKYTCENDILVGMIGRYILDIKNIHDEDRISVYHTFFNMVRSIYTHQYTYMCTITLLVYTTNDEYMMYEYCKIVGIQTLISHHNIIKLCYNNSQYDRSMNAIIKSINQYYIDNNQHVKIDDTIVKKIIMMKKDRLLRDNMGRKMLTLLLFSIHGSPVSIELNDEMSSMAKFYHDGDVFRNNLSMNDMVVAVRKSRLEKKNVEHLTTHQTMVSLIKIDISAGSQYSRSLFLTFNNVSDDEMKNQYKSVIYYKWDTIFIYTLMYSIIYWTMGIFSYVYYSDYLKDTMLGVSILVFNGILGIMEMRCFVVDVYQWVSSVWNWIDLFILVYSSSAVCLFLTVVEAQDSIGATWVRMSIMMMVGMRSITWLRIFRPTRYLIKMVLQVSIDIVPFLIILLSVMFIFAFMWRMSPRLGYIDEDSLDHVQLTFYESIYDTTNIIFGNTPQEDSNGNRFTPIRFLVIIIGNVALALALLNFLIAIISGTYQKINDDRDLHDVKELLSMIVEFDTLLCRKNKPEDMKYIMYVKPIDLSNLEKKMDDMDEKIEAMNRDMKKVVSEMKNESCKKMDDVSKKLDETNLKMEDSEKKTGECHSKMDESNKKLDETNKKLEKVMEYLHNISERGAGKGGVNPYDLVDKEKKPFLNQQKRGVSVSKYYTRCTKKEMYNI